MQINNNNYSIIEIKNMLDRRELIVNREYQRGSGLWPQHARSYFIDTIIHNYPFPKIYMYEYIERRTQNIRKELVDGQQRVTTIIDFLLDKFALSGEATNVGCKFSDLDEDIQQEFLSYSVAVDVIRNATHSNILQMFRRMNAFTLPLNQAEKRHSEFYGEFKWAVNALSVNLGEFFVEYGVFSNRQIVRMADAELISDCILAIEKGIVSTSPTDLRNLYKSYDENFPHRDEYMRSITSAFDYIIEHLSILRKTHMMKPYALHSLVTALMYSMRGIDRIDQQLRVVRSANYPLSNEAIADRLRELADAHEAKEVDGPHHQYVWGCLGGTNRAPRRAARITGILRALGYEVERIEDADIAAQVPR